VDQDSQDTPVRIAVTPCRRPADYDASVRKAGGEPWVPVIGADDPDDVLARAGGLLLTGGDDIDPALFGALPHPAYEPAEPGRDAYELALVRRALAAHVPVLAICRGLQVLNVAAGGTLIQDIPTERRSAINHAGASSATLAHPVQVTPGSRLDRMLARPADTGPVMVNSRHHQAVDVLGDGLVVTAQAPDGIIEGMEGTGPSFCVAVQWHPESFHRTGEFDRLFSAFVAACAARSKPSP
jgi:putative glutamine amidotransferase